MGSDEQRSFSATFPAFHPDPAQDGGPCQGTLQSCRQPWVAPSQSMAGTRQCPWLWFVTMSYWVSGHVGADLASVLVCPCGRVWLPVHTHMCACLQACEFLCTLCMPVAVRVRESAAGLRVCVCASGRCVWACVFAVCACLCVRAVWACAHACACISTLETLRGVWGAVCA